MIFVLHTFELKAWHAVKSDAMYNEYIMSSQIEHIFCLLIRIQPVRFHFKIKMKCKYLICTIGTSQNGIHQKYALIFIIVPKLK